MVSLGRETKRQREGTVPVDGNAMGLEPGKSLGLKLCLPCNIDVIGDTARGEIIYVLQMQL